MVEVGVVFQKRTELDSYQKKIHVLPKELPSDLRLYVQKLTNFSKILKLEKNNYLDARVTIIMRLLSTLKQN